MKYNDPRIAQDGRNIQEAHLYLPEAMFLNGSNAPSNLMPPYMSNPQLSRYRVIGQDLSLIL